MKDLFKKSTKDELEEFKKIEPKKVIFNNSAEKFAFVYNLLLSKWYTLLHDIDAE